MTNYHFTIGITYYDRYSYLLECLNSCYEQNYPKECFEVIVINDNPTQKLNFTSNHFPDMNLRILNHEVNRGEIYSMNELLRMAKGEYFTWLADDDLISPFFLRESLRKVKELNKPDCIYFGYQSFCENASAIRKELNVETDPTIRLLAGSDWIVDYLKGDIGLIGTYGSFRTNSLLAYGEIKETMRGKSGLYIDTLLPILLSFDNRVLFCSGKYFYFRIHGESYSNDFKNILLMGRSQIKFITTLAPKIARFENLAQRRIVVAALERFMPDSWSISCRRFNLKILRLLAYIFASLTLTARMARISPYFALSTLKVAYLTLLRIRRSSNVLK